MKHLLLVVMIMVVSGCGTVGGAVSGAGDDLKKAGEWVKSR
jgi:predicted small secreted protein